MPVVGVITPEAHAAVQATRNRRVGLLATEATVRRAATPSSSHRSTPASASSRRVPAARAADRGRRPFGEETVAAVREYAAPLKAEGVDTVILGCTHYPLIRPILQRVFGRGVTLVFSAEETAREVAETLARKGIENDAARMGSYRFLTTGDPRLFRDARRAVPPAPARRGRARDADRARGGLSVAREGGRRPDQLRPLDAPARLPRAAARLRALPQGRTIVLCTASVEERVPRWLCTRGAAG